MMSSNYSDTTMICMARAPPDHRLRLADVRGHLITEGNEKRYIGGLI